MKLRESDDKTRKTFTKTLDNLRCVFFDKPCKTLLLKPFSCLFYCCSKSKSIATDDCYTEFLNILESDLDKRCKRRKLSNPGQREETNYDQEGRRNKEKELTAEEKLKQRQKEKEEKESMVKKIKELDSMDIEQSLDVEEAVHYYSQLRSPIYLDIVDRFFNDIQESSSSFKNSKRRRASLRFQTI